MSATSVESVGFTHPGREARVRERRSAIVVHLVASAALSLSIVVAVVTVSISLARTGGERPETVWSPSSRDLVQLARRS
jgi:hypothetical protein